MAKWDYLEKASAKEVAEGVIKDSGEKEETRSESNLRRLEIEPADNGGFTVAVSRKPKKIKAKEGEPQLTCEEPKRNVFSTHAEMMAYVNRATK